MEKVIKLEEFDINKLSIYKWNNEIFNLKNRKKHSKDILNLNLSYNNTYVPLINLGFINKSNIKDKWNKYYKNDKELYIISDKINNFFDKIYEFLDNFINNEEILKDKYNSLRKRYLAAERFTLSNDIKIYEYLDDEFTRIKELSKYNNYEEQNTKNEEIKRLLLTENINFNLYIKIQNIWCIDKQLGFTIKIEKIILYKENYNNYFNGMKIIQDEDIIVDENSLINFKKIFKEKIKYELKDEYEEQIEKNISNNLINKLSQTQELQNLNYDVKNYCLNNVNSYINDYLNNYFNDINNIIDKLNDKQNKLYIIIFVLFLFILFLLFHIFILNH